MGSNSQALLVIETCQNSSKNTVSGHEQIDFFFLIILLFFLSLLWNWDSSILTFQLSPLFSFQVAYYSRRDFCIPDPHPGHAVSPQVEVPCLDAERHSGECLFTGVH